MYSVEINTGLWLFERLDDAKASVVEGLNVLAPDKIVEFGREEFDQTIDILLGTPNRMRKIGHIYVEVVHRSKLRLPIMLP
jgi:hypothetical protein